MSISINSGLSNETIVLVCAADDNYSMPLAATLHSAIVNLKSERNVALFVIDGGITRANKRKILQTISSPKVSLNWLKPQRARLKNLPISQTITIAAYYRIWISDLLPNWFNKAIYLDDVF